MSVSSTNDNRPAHDKIGASRVIESEPADINDRQYPNLAPNRNGQARYRKRDNSSQPLVQLARINNKYTLRGVSQSGTYCLCRIVSTTVHFRRGFGGKLASRPASTSRGGKYPKLASNRSGQGQSGRVYNNTTKQSDLRSVGNLADNWYSLDRGPRLILKKRTKIFGADHRTRNYGIVRAGDLVAHCKQTGGHFDTHIKELHRTQRQTSYSIQRRQGWDILKSEKAKRFFTQLGALAFGIVLPGTKGGQERKGPTHSHKEYRGREDKFCDCDGILDLPGNISYRLFHGFLRWKYSATILHGSDRTRLRRYLDWRKKTKMEPESENKTEQKEEGTHTFHIKLENLAKNNTEYSAVQRNASWDNDSYATDDLYDGPNDPKEPVPAIPVVQEKGEMDPVDSNTSGAEDGRTSGEADSEGYTMVGTGGKVRWEFVLTAATTDEEIDQTSTARLLSAVSEVENHLGNRVQEPGVSLGPKEQARRARAAISLDGQKNIGSRKDTSKGMTNVLTRNIALSMDSTVVQSPGLRVTEEEQTLANAGLLEYTFQVEFKLKTKVTEIGMFQEFARKVMAAEPTTRFLPWYGEDTDLPEIDQKHLPYSTIKGKARLRHYIGGLNRNKGKIYGHVKVQSKATFVEIKENIVDWLRQDLHWIKEDYLQTRRVSNIGLLAGTHGVVDLKRTRDALENAVEREIQRKVKLDLRLRKVRCKNARGNEVTTTIYGVSVDACQVSEAVKGLRAVLHCKCRPPTGRQLVFVTRSRNDDVVDVKMDATLTAHYESIVNEKRLYRTMGVPLTKSVKLREGPVVTLQQAICMIPSSDGKRLFTGVECMGNTATVVFTYHKRYIKEARKTVSILHKVLQDVLDKQSYAGLVPGLSPRPTPELEALRQQESDYLDGFLNLHHYSEIDLTKKRKMDDDTVGARTAVSGLTNVSPQSNPSNGTAWTKKRHVQQQASQADSVCMDYKTADAEKMEDFVKESQRHKQEIEKMGNELKRMQEALKQLTATQSAQEEANKRRERWETTLSAQFEAERQERRDNAAEMMKIMQFVLANSQKGHTSVPPANLGIAIDNRYNAGIGQTTQVIPATQQGQYSDPLPNGSEKI